MKANIIILAHPEHFDELALAFKFALEKLKGAVVEIYGDVPARREDFGDLNIYITGLKQLKSGQYDNRRVNVLCQVEELWKDREENKYRGFGPYSRILELYDINTKIRNTGNVRFFPLGYSEAFGEPEDREEFFDVFFFGSKRGLWGENRRFPVQNILREEGWNTIFSDKIVGEERTRFINESRINLFIRHSNRGLYSPLRALSIQSRGKFFLNEVCQEGYGPYQPGKHFMEYRDSKDLLQKIRYWIENERERKEFAAAAREDLMKNHHFEDYFVEAMKGIL